MDFKIRKLEIADIDQVYELGNLKEEFTTESGSFWSKEQLESWSQSKNDIMLVAEIDRKIAGFSLYALHTPTGKATWENIYISPEYRERGIGSALIKTGLEMLQGLGCKYVMCCVNSTDPNQFAEYLKKFGFKIYGNVLWVDKAL